MRRVLILGLGNSLLTDDAVGIHVVRHLAEEAAAEGVDTLEAEIGGFALLDILDGYDAVVAVDAVNLPNRVPGEIIRFDPRAQQPSLHLVSGHQIDIASALELAVALGLEPPRDVIVIGIQIEDMHTFGEECTPKVSAAVPEAARRTLDAARDFRDRVL